MTYLNHITLNTGHLARVNREEVSSEATQLLGPWLKTIINTEETYPLPVEDWAWLGAKAFVQDGGLVVTVYGRKPDIGPRLPWVTFGVAQKSRHSNNLWGLLVANFGAHPKAKVPSTPWCAVAVLDTAPKGIKILQMLADFERCAAWAWITRNPSLTVTQNDDRRT